MDHEEYTARVRAELDGLSERLLALATVELETEDGPFLGRRTRYREQADAMQRSTLEALRALDAPQDLDSQAEAAWAAYEALLDAEPSVSAARPLDPALVGDYESAMRSLGIEPPGP